MIKREDSLIFNAFLAAVPLFYGAKSINHAVFLCTATFFSVFIFELLFFATKSFWLYSARSLFSLLVFGVMASFFILIAAIFSGPAVESLSVAFPLTVMSAFLISRRISGSFRQRMALRTRSAAFFFIFVLMAGALHQSNEILKSFPTAVFWMSGIIFAAVSLVKQKTPFLNG